jgi:receptor-type tyrosine-protein phosphatase A
MLSLWFCLPTQKLTSIKIQNDKMRTGNLPANMKKNRVLQIIPCELTASTVPDNLA